MSDTKRYSRPTTDGVWLSIVAGSDVDELINLKAWKQFPAYTNPTTGEVNEATVAFTAQDIIAYVPLSKVNELLAANRVLEGNWIQLRVQPSGPAKGAKPITALNLGGE